MFAHVQGNWLCTSWLQRIFSPLLCRLSYPAVTDTLLPGCAGFSLCSNVVVGQALRLPKRLESLDPRIIPMACHHSAFVRRLGAAHGGSMTRSFAAVYTYSPRLPRHRNPRVTGELFALWLALPGLTEFAHLLMRLDTKFQHSPDIAARSS